MGWQSCPFLVTPQEIKTALEPFGLVINNACVPIDYTNTSIEEFLKIYSALYERLISGEVFDGKWVKAVIYDKKSVLPYLAPFTFHTYTENNKLYVSTRFSYLAYSESIFGYEINFPKFSQSDANYYGLTSEKEFKAYPDYELFRRNIIKITKPFSFKLNGVVKKTSIRISEEVKAYLPNFNCIKSRNIEVL